MNNELYNYIKVSNSPNGCDSYNAKQFKCDRYLDCESCLEDKIKEHDKQVIEQYTTSIHLEDTIRHIHYSVAQEMYHKAIDDFANWLVEQGILGSRCISDGEITDYGKVYAKKYKEQLKAIEIVKQSDVSDDTDNVCEWIKIDEEGYNNCKCNYDETMPDFFKYCPYCGKRIKVVK